MTIRHEIFFLNHPASNKQDEILELLSLIIKNQKIMGQELTDLQAAVAKEITVEQSAVALLVGLKAKLDAAGTDPVALAALSAQIGTSSEALAAAVVANTPVVTPVVTPAV